MRRLSGLVLLLALSACSSLSQTRHDHAPPHPLDCPNRPNCVSSQSTDPARRVAAFELRQPGEAAWNALIRLLADQPHARLLNAEANEATLEFDTASGMFTDDLRLVRDPAVGRVQVRSASRVGYFDFGANRRRVENLRALLLAAELIRH